MDYCLELLKNTWLGSFISAIVGGLIAGTASLLATRQAHRNNLELQSKNNSIVIKRIIQAIHDEITTIWELYEKKVGPEIEKLNEGEPLLLYFPIGQEYFTIYNANAAYIGSIENHDLRKAIVMTYTKAKNIIDNLKMNDELLSKYEHLNLLFRTTNIPQYGQDAHGWYLGLVKYAEKLRQTHFELKAELVNLTRLLKESGAH